jgi:YHS domain-containing protein
MDQMSRPDPSDQNMQDPGLRGDMTDASGTQSLDEMQSMRDSEDLLDTEGGIPGMTGPGTQASRGMRGAQGGQWSSSQSMSSQSQGQDQGQGMGMSVDPNSPDQQALNPDVEFLDENDPNVARDPVCGRLVDKRTAQNTLASPVNEQMGTVYFHSPECKAIFEADPHRFGSNF